jgi:hypothetical protein
MDGPKDKVERGFVPPKSPRKPGEHIEEGFVPPKPPIKPPVKPPKERK